MGRERDNSRPREFTRTRPVAESRLRGLIVEKQGTIPRVERLAQRLGLPPGAWKRRQDAERRAPVPILSRSQGQATEGALLATRVPFGTADAREIRFGHHR